MSRVCAFTAVCQEDAQWIPQYLAEVERVRVPFAIHFDRCHFPIMADHSLCIASSVQPNKSKEFTEQHKQDILDMVRRLDFDWALAWDIDETFERKAEGPWDLDSAIDHYQMRWLNLWDDRDHIRVDLNYAISWRVKLLNLRHRWMFDHPITNGPKAIGIKDPSLAKLDLVCLHWGMMTHSLRKFHKERWDRIYSKALRGDPNPYGFWNQALDPNITPVTVKHGYFQ